MTKAKNETGGAMTAKVADAISDGNGGWLAVGAKFQPADEQAAKELKAKGLAD